MQGAIASKACKLEEQKDKGRTKNCSTLIDI